MALEDLTGTKYLDSLVATNPASGDFRYEGDDHLRGIKNVLKKTWANITGAVTATQDDLDKTKGLPTIAGGDAAKVLEVNPGETGYQLTTRAASATATGLIELATQAEVDAGTDTTRAVTPAKLAASSGAARRNLLINGSMLQAQRGASFAAIANNEFPLDRWKINYSSTAVLTISRALAYVPGWYYLNALVTFADAAMGANDYCNIVYKSEGYDTSVLNWGYSTAKTVTISFQHAHTAVGTYTVALRNGVANRRYVAEYQQNVSNAWEKTEITIPGDTTGTWSLDETAGVTILFSMGTGTANQVAPDAWGAGGEFSTSSQINMVGTVSNALRLAQVQLEVGSHATAFDAVSIATEKDRCLRYYTKASGTAIGFGYAVSSTDIRIFFPFTTTLRADPAITVAIGSVLLKGAGTSLTPSAGIYSQKTSSGVILKFTVSGAIANQAYSCYMVASNIEFDAEIT